MAAPKLTLYIMPGSCSFVAHAVLRQLSIPFDLVRLTRSDSGLVAADGSFTSAEYRTLHPKSKVPGLRIPLSPTTGVATPLLAPGENDSGPQQLSGPAALSLENATFLTELPAIVEFIAGLSPQGAALLGGNGLARARVAEWAAFLVGNVQAVHWAGIFKSPTPEARESAVASTCEVYASINKRLEGRTFAVGEDLTAADFFLYLWYRVGAWLKLVEDPVKEWPAWSAHYKLVEGLPAIRQTLKAEGLPFSE